MKHVFLDTDVIMDFLTKRAPFAYSAMKLMEYGQRKSLRLSVSSLSISHANYLIGRLENKSKAREKIKLLLELVEVLPVQQSTIRKATYSKFKDFEDAIQNFCAEENDTLILITRNVKDYQQSNLAIQTPVEFLSKFES